MMSFTKEVNGQLILSLYEGDPYPVALDWAKAVLVLTHHAAIKAWIIEQDAKSWRRSGGRAPEIPL